MKKICVFNDFQLPMPPVRGGSVACLTDFILKENEKQHLYDIDVFSRYDADAEREAENYKYTRFYFIKDANRTRFKTNLKFELNNKFHFKFDLSDIPLPRSARKIFLKNHYDAVYITGYIRGALSIIKLSQAPCIVHHHTVTDLLHEKSIQGENLVNSASRIFFCSKFAADFARNGTSEQNAKMVVLPNAVDTLRFEFENREKIRQEIREQYGIGKDDIVIIFVGRLVKYKGALELINAFNACKFDVPVKLMIVGGATYSSKKATPYVKKCMDCAIQNKDIILTGFVNYNDIPKYYAASDIGTMISFVDECAGLVGIESMAAGLPVITTDRGGIPNFITPDCKVVVHEGENIEKEIAESLTLLADNKDLRIKMGNAGLERAKQFDKKSYFENFSRLIDDVISH